MSTKNFPAKTPQEIKLCTFDFTAEATGGTTFSAPTVTKTLVDGTDTGAASLTVGTPAINGFEVKVLIGAGLDGSRYKLVAQVDASNGERHTLGGIMAVKDSAA